MRVCRRGDIARFADVIAGWTPDGQLALSECCAAGLKVTGAVVGTTRGYIDIAVAAASRSRPVARDQAGIEPARSG
jgi:hypothetical protein